MPDQTRNEPVSSLRIKEENPGMWQDFYLEIRPFHKQFFYKNDFLIGNGEDFADTAVGTSNVYLLDERNGVLRIESGSSSGDGIELQIPGGVGSETVGEAFAPAAGKNVWFETRIRSNDVLQTDFFVGLHVQDTAFVASKGSDYIGFTNNGDGSALINCVTAASSVVSTEVGVATFVNDTFIKLGYKVTGTQKVEFYVNDVLISTLTQNIPTDLMKISLGALTGENSANSLDIDYVVAAQDR